MHSLLNLGQLSRVATVLIFSLTISTACVKASETWVPDGEQLVMNFMETWLWGDPHVPLQAMEAVVTQKDRFDCVIQMSHLEYASCQGGILVMRWIDDHPDLEADEEASSGGGSLKLAFDTILELIDGPLPFADVIAEGLHLNGLINTATSIDAVFSGTGDYSRG
ncbi:MAG: hypothetical protein AAF802_23550 [Planctomycetota bacterium]